MAKLRNLTPSERETYGLRYETVIRPAIYARCTKRKLKANAFRELK